MLNFISVKAQNKPVLYGFDHIPQSLLLNPGAKTTNRYHIGIPLFSGISANVGMSGITVADVFRSDGISFFSGTNFNSRLRSAIDRLSSDDYASINTQIEVLSGGLKINRRDYLSFGFYTEIDAFTTFPKDIFTLIDEGNAAFLNKTFSLSHLSVKSEVVGVWHVGVSRKYDDKLTVGGRFKLYSGAINVTSSSNEGYFTTVLGQDNIYEHSLSGIDAGAFSSGIYNENDEVDISAGEIIGNSFFGNLGIGIDLGFTYSFDEQTQISASLLDVGFISYANKTRNYEVNGNYVFSGIDFQFDSQNADYWQELNDELEEQIPREENNNSYSVLRPIKFYGSFAYSFGKSRSVANCHDISYKNFYDNTVGGQLYTIFRPNGPRFALTGFYERKLSERFNTKFTYTIDDFSYSSIGMGLSARLGKVNVYGMLDNFFGIFDIADAHKASFQLGVNLIYN